MALWNKTVVMRPQNPIERAAIQSYPQLLFIVIKLISISEIKPGVR